MSTTTFAGPGKTTDGLRLDFTLTEPDLSTAALATITRQLAATAPEYDKTGAVPIAGLEAVHRAGYLTATVSKRYGGAELGPVDVARLLIALGKGDPAVALIVANTLATHSGQAAAVRGADGHPLRGWPEDVYLDFLRLSAERPAPANAIRAEPELGAPARGGLPATVARRTPTGWSVSGRKAYATGGEALAYHLVWAVTDETVPRVGHVIVPSATSGITWVKTWDHLGQRASNTHDVIYSGAQVPENHFQEIPFVNGVYRDPAVAAGPGTLNHLALYIGVARAAEDAFADFARSRVPSALGKPIAETERIQRVAGEIHAQIVQAEALLFGTLARLTADAGSEESAELIADLSVVKALIARAVTAATHAAVESIGNPGLSRHLPLERHLRDSLSIRVHPPQEDAALLTAGRRVLAVPAS